VGAVSREGKTAIAAWMYTPWPWPHVDHHHFDLGENLGQLSEAPRKGKGRAPGVDEKRDIQVFGHFGDGVHHFFVGHKGMQEGM